MMCYHNGNRAKVQELLAEGHRGVDIAAMLGVSPGTVYHHKYAISVRLRTYNGAENRAKVQELWDEGYGVRPIARLTGLPRSTVQHHVRQIKKEQRTCPQSLTPKEIKS